MSDLTELSILRAGPGLRDLIVRGGDDVWFRLHGGRLGRGPAVADSDQDLVNPRSPQTGLLRKPEGDRPHAKEET